jgi:hypothetical protein
MPLLGGCRHAPQRLLLPRRSPVPGRGRFLRQRERHGAGRTRRYRPLVDPRARGRRGRGAGDARRERIVRRDLQRGQLRAFHRARQGLRPGRPLPGHGQQRVRGRDARDLVPEGERKPRAGWANPHARHDSALAGAHDGDRERRTARAGVPPDGRRGRRRIRGNAGAARSDAQRRRALARGARIEGLGRAPRGAAPAASGRLLRPRALTAAPVANPAARRDRLAPGSAAALRPGRPPAAAG